MKTGFVKSHFLDSGAFSLSRRIPRSQQKEYYDSEEFWDYIDSYAAFIKKYKIAIDLYANVDVIGNPDLTYRNQKYLEGKYKLKPVPVVHYGTDLKWFERYIREGYEIIGLGGLVRNTGSIECQNWLDCCFRLVCPPPSQLPIVKIHGFGMTKVDFIFRYPWWSVDATTIERMSRYGIVMVPRKTRGQYDFRKHYHNIATSSRVTTSKLSMHSYGLTNLEKREVKKWLNYINNSNFFNRRLVFETNAEYKAANYFYYMELLKHIPEWPWPFRIKKRTLL